jgi:hypothetical protein
LRKKGGKFTGGNLAVIAVCEEEHRSGGRSGGKGTCVGLIAGILDWDGMLSPSSSCSGEMELGLIMYYVSGTGRQGSMD